MARSKTHRIAAALWITGGLLLLLLTILGRMPITPKVVTLVLLLAVLLLFIFIIIGVGLAICYHNEWESWRPWPFFVITIIITGTLSQRPIIIGPIDFQAAASLVFVSTGAALVTALGIILFRHDVGLALIAWLSLGAMWMLVIWWQVGGDFLEPIIKAFASAGASSSPIFWLSVLVTTSMCCLLPLALASFVWHSVRLVRRELRKEAIPAHPTNP